MDNNTKIKLHNLVKKYRDNRETYRMPRFNETMLRNEFLDPLFELLGWDIKNTQGKSTIYREVWLEESLKSDIDSNAKKPDYTFRLFGERKYFLEAKKPCVNIDIDDAPAKQVRRYGFSAGLRISVLSNFEYLYIYDTSYAVENSDSRTKALIGSYHYLEYEEKFEELLRKLGRESVYSGEFDEVWSNIELNLEQKTIDKFFLNQINAWRLLLGKQILQHIPDIDMIELGDIVQSYINKILFLRVCEDRNIEVYQSLLHIAEIDKGEKLIEKFKEADRKYNSGLFAERLSEDIICNLSSSFWTIIRQLYYPECPYSFSVLSSDILGRIYEIFIAQRLMVKDNELIIVNKPENEERDIVTTPLYIVKEILFQTIGDSLKKKDWKSFREMKFADIACGSGVFLLELYQLLQDILIDYYIEHDRSKLVPTSIDTFKLSFEIKRQLLTHCIFGVDKDFNAVEACKFGLLLKLIEDEDETTLSVYHPILPLLDNNIFYGNSLLSMADVSSEQMEEVNPFEFNNMKFDYIVGNPPYMKTEDIKKFTPLEHRLYPKKYVSAYKQYDKYFLFIERALSLLKPEGKLGYIVPSKFMKVGSAVQLRDLITKGRNVASITSFGAHQVFQDKSTYSSIIVLQNSPIERFIYREIEDLKCWRLHDKNSQSVSQRYADHIGRQTWLLCSDLLQPILDKILSNSIPLGEIVGDEYIFNGIQTSANKVYVFTPLSEDKNYYWFKAFNGREYQIEKTVTKPYFKTVQGEESLYSYHSFKPNARVIFPYKKNQAGHVELISLETIQKKYPFMYSYLVDVKFDLNKASRDIKPTPTTNNEWYRYGRQQSLDACEVAQKMIVGVLSQSDKYAIDIKGTLVSSGGTAGYCMVTIPADQSYSIYYIQALLGSVQGEWLASLYGEIFRGGYIARGTKVLKQLPIRVIDFNNPKEVATHNEIVERQKELIAIGDKLAKVENSHRKRIPLQRQFDVIREAQQDAINTLYGITKDEQKIIPLIKEIYATK